MLPRVYLFCDDFYHDVLILPNIVLIFLQKNDRIVLSFLVHDTCARTYFALLQFQTRRNLVHTDFLNVLVV